MGAVLMILGVVFCIASAVCSIIVLIDAFRNEIWKGVLGLLCGLYLLIYAFTEYDGDNKTMIILGILLGGLIGGALMGAGGAMSGAR